MRCAWAYHKDECMSKSRTSKVLCQLTRRFSIPVVAEEECREKGLLGDKHISSKRLTRKRDYEGDISSRRSSPDKQPRTAPLLGNTSEEAIYFISLPREIGGDSSNISSTSPGAGEQYGSINNNDISNSNPSTPRNDTTNKIPTVMDPCCIEGTTEDSLMEMFYPTRYPNVAKSSSSVSAPQQQQQQSVTESMVNATGRPGDYDNGNDSRPNSGLFTSCDIQGQGQQHLQQTYNIPASTITSNSTRQQQEHNQFDLVNSLLMVEQQEQPQSQQQPQTEEQQDLNAQFATSMLNNADGANFDLSSLSSDVPMWNLPSGVTWGEWDALLNDSSQQT